MTFRILEDLFWGLPWLYVNVLLVLEVRGIWQWECGRRVNRDGADVIRQGARSACSSSAAMATALAPCFLKCSVRRKNLPDNAQQSGHGTNDGCRKPLVSYKFMLCVL